LTSGGIVRPKDKFQEFVEFSKEMGRRQIGEIGVHPKGVYATLMSDIPELYEMAVK